MKKKIIIGLSCLAFSAVGVAACGTNTGGDTISTTENTTQESTTKTSEEATVSASQKAESSLKKNLDNGESLCYFDIQNDLLRAGDVVFNLNGEVVNNKAEKYQDYVFSALHPPESVINHDAKYDECLGVRNLDGRSYIAMRETMVSVDGTKFVDKIYTSDGNVIFEKEETKVGNGLNDVVGLFHGEWTMDKLDTAGNDYGEWNFESDYGNERERYFFVATGTEGDSRTIYYGNIYKIQDNSVELIDSDIRVEFGKDSYNRVNTISRDWYLGDGYYVIEKNSDTLSIKKDGNVIIDDIKSGIRNAYDQEIDPQYNSGFILTKVDDDNWKLFDGDGKEILNLSDASQFGGSTIEDIKLLKGKNVNGYMTVYFKNKDGSSSYHGIFDKNGNKIIEPAPFEYAGQKYDIYYIRGAYDDSFYSMLGSVYDKSLNNILNAHASDAIIVDDQLVYYSGGKMNSFDFSTKQSKVLFEV